MRGCLTFLVTIAVVAAALAWFLPPPIADAVLSQTLSVVLGGPTTARVVTDFPPSLLTLHADEVEVTGSDAKFASGALRAGTVDLTLRDVDLVARSAASVAGSLAAVTLDTTELGAVAIERIALSGPTSAVDATATVGAAEAERIVTSAITAATGRTASGVQLVPPDAARASVGRVAITAHLVVSNGSLVARVDQPGIAPVTLLAASSLAPLELTGVTVQGGGLLLSGRLSASSLGL